ncbi:type II toxin-antitoxin system Phd/YefM family antitoxin [Brevundimonas sp.]|uniref:type II toxin-antitoxin system Phd/YefM family antitoxin n=1 Tax=Brevundimonas sp. TaxID=1871086 RepID=UPI003D0AAE4B
MHLLKRVEQDETIIITRAGKPVAKLTPLDPEKTDRVALAKRRLGFLRGEMTIPDDFNEMGREDIERLFNGDE